MNRLIEKLDFSCDITCDKKILYLIPFFVNNKATETLEITYINTDGSNLGRLDTLEYALYKLSFTILGVHIACNGFDNRKMESLTAALVNNDCLKELDLCRLESLQLSFLMDLSPLSSP